MSGLRMCDDCGNLFKIQNDGPEMMDRSGNFPRHVCPKCKEKKAPPKPAGTK